MSLLEIKDIHAGYNDTTVLQGVTAEVDEGDIVCFIGPNGAGKSTMFRCIYNLLTLSEGDIRFKGKSIVGLSQAELLSLGIGYVFQRNAIFEKMSVRENLEMGAYIKGRNFDLEKRLEEVYDVFPLLRERSDDKAGTFSGGQRQMLEFGRGLMIKPDLLLLDEPTAGLAPKIIDQVFEQVEEINSMGVTIVMIEQNIKSGLKHADYVYVLEDGQTVFSGPASTILDEPEIRSAYLGDNT